MTNSYQSKRVGMIGYGLEITDYISFNLLTKYKSWIINELKK